MTFEERFEAAIRAGYLFGSAVAIARYGIRLATPTSIRVPGHAPLWRLEKR